MNEILTREIPIMMSGLPGNMASLVAEEIATRQEFELFPIALSSPRHNGESLLVRDRRYSDLYRNVYLFSALTLNGWRNLISDGSIAIDFTIPTACVTNARLYSEMGISFVMGTSGGNREEMEEIVRRSRTCAVIAANMDPQIIRRQIDIDEFAETNPGVFRGATVEITESHQKTKRDVSGTAIAFRSQFERYGALPNGRITSIRDTEIQESLGIPNPDSGHAYHWVEVKTPNGEIIYQINTAVQGRTSYVEGTLMAAQFLSRQIALGTEGQVFSMRDVLKGGDK